MRDATPRSAVFLDRDGVLIDVRIIGGRPHPVERLEDVRILDGVDESCRALKAAGAVLVLVTNQPDVARGATTRAFVDDVNSTLAASLGIDDVQVCFHDDSDACTCRKPRPGLLFAAAEGLGIQLSTSVMVGDRWRDIEAGRAAGVRTVFIDRKYDERRPLGSDLEVGTLAEAVPFILRLIAHPG